MPHWVWVVDTTTGHRMDVERRSLRYGLEPLNDPRYPDLKGPMARPRRAKHFVGKDGKAGQYVHGESSFDDADEQAPVEGRSELTENSRASSDKQTGKTRTKTPAREPADSTSAKE